MRHRTDPIDQINNAYERLAKSDVKYRLGYVLNEELNPERVKSFESL